MHPHLVRKVPFLIYMADVHLLHYLNVIMLQRSHRVMNVRQSSLYRCPCDNISTKSHIFSEKPIQPHKFQVQLQKGSEFSTCTMMRNGKLSCANSADSMAKSKAESEKKSFRETLDQTCNPCDVIEHLDICCADGVLCPNELPVMFSRIEEMIYCSQAYPELLSERHRQKMQFELNVSCLSTMEALSSSQRFQSLLSCTENCVDKLSTDGCLEILHCLEYLFVSSPSSLIYKLHEKCIENIRTLDIHRLATISSSLRSQPRDFVGLGKVADALKMLLQTTSLDNIDIPALCCVIENVKDVASTHLFELALETIKEKIYHDFSSLSLANLGKICALSHICDNEIMESVQAMFSSISTRSFNQVDITDSNLTFDVASDINKNPELCPVLHRLRSHCVSELYKRTDLSVQDIIRYLLPLDDVPWSIIQDKTSMLIYCAEHVDNFLLFQLISKFSVVDISQLPKGRELLEVIHDRLLQVFTSLAEDQLGQLVWQNDGELAKILFKFLRKISVKGFQLNGTVVDSLGKQLRLQSSEWDVSKVKVALTASWVIKLLKLDVCQSSPELWKISKLFCRLDYGDIMNLHRQVENTFLQSSESVTVKKQAHQLGNKLADLFHSKLSRSNDIAPSMVSNNILPLTGRTKSGRWSIQLGLYFDLVRSFPRFIADDQWKNCNRVLRILAMGSEKVPVHQEKMFENLIQCMTSDANPLLQSALDLVKILASAGYPVETSEIFMSWISHFVHKTLEDDTLDKLSQVQLAYHLSLLGLFYDDLLLQIFSLDFISALEKDLFGSPQQLLKSKTDLALLNRSVAIECPHLSVSWFGKSSLPSDGALKKSRSAQRMVDSLGRLCGGANYIVRNSESPYLHHIDALLYFTDKVVLVKPGDIKNKHIQDSSEKLALIHLNEEQFCLDSDKMTGQCLSDIRHLQMLGYVVIPVCHFELSSMGIHNEQSLDDFLRSKINGSLGFQLLAGSADH